MHKHQEFAILPLFPPPPMPVHFRHSVQIEKKIFLAYTFSFTEVIPQAGMVERCYHLKNFHHRNWLLSFVILTQ